MYRSRRRTIRTTATADPQYPATCRNTRPASPPAVTIPGATASSATGNPPGAAAGNRRYIPAQSVYPAPEATRHRATRHRRQPRQPKPAHPAPPARALSATGNRQPILPPYTLSILPELPFRGSIFSPRKRPETRSEHAHARFQYRTPKIPPAQSAQGQCNKYRLTS